MKDIMAPPRIGKSETASKYGRSSKIWRRSFDITPLLDIDDKDTQNSIKNLNI